MEGLGHAAEGSGVKALFIKVCHYGFAYNLVPQKQIILSCVDPHSIK